MNDDNLLSTKELARKLGYSPRQLARWRESGEGPVYLRIGHGRGLIRYKWGDVKAWLATRQRGHGDTVTVVKGGACVSLIAQLPAAYRVSDCFGGEIRPQPKRDAA
jgi:predicted DNA-binding transcriptional regulator AlpA